MLGVDVDSLDVDSQVLGLTCQAALKLGPDICGQCPITDLKSS